MHEAGKLLTNIDWMDGTYATLDGADVVAILTEWNEFRALDLGEVKRRLKRPVMVDLRNVYALDEMAEAGFDYYSLGRRTVRAAG